MSNIRPQVIYNCHYGNEALSMWCRQCTLIQFAKFSAKILLMAKLLQNYSNLNDLEYSRHLKARKVEKRPKNFLKAKQRPEVEKPKFS